MGRYLRHFRYEPLGKINLIEDKMRGITHMKSLLTSAHGSLNEVENELDSLKSSVLNLLGELREKVIEK